MNPRTTGVLFLVALALGAFVWFYQVQGEDRRRAAEEEAKRLFPGIDQDDIRALAFTTTGGQEVRVEFREEGWVLVEPLEFPADEAGLSGMASALAQLSSEGRLEDPQAPAVYGLGDSARVVRFETAAGEHAVRFGDKTPVGGNTYAAVEGQPGIYTVPSYRATSFERALDDLRERRVLRFDRTAVDRIEVEWAGGGVALERRDTGWWLTAPLEGPADEKTVEDLLADLAFLRAEGFVDDPAPEMEESLQTPRLRVVLTDRPEEEVADGGADEPAEEPGEAAAPRSWTLAVGAAVEEGQRAVRGAGGHLYAVARERLAELPRRVDAYRFRTLASFPASEAERLELVFHRTEGEPVVVTARRGEEGWTSEPEPIAADKAAALVSEVSHLRAEGIVADSMGPEELSGVGLRPPRVLYRLWGAPPEAGGEPLRLAEVALGTFDPEEGIVAKAADRDTVYRLDYELAESLPVSLEAFRNRFLAPEDAGESEAPVDGEGAGEGGVGEDAEESSPSDS